MCVDNSKENFHILIEYYLNGLNYDQDPTLPNMDLSVEFSRDANQSYAWHFQLNAHAHQVSNIYFNYILYDGFSNKKIIVMEMT